MFLSKIIPPSLVLVSLAILYLSFNIEGQKITDPSSASFFPAVIAVIMTICSILIAIRGINNPFSDKKDPAVEHAESETASDEDETVFEKENITRKQINKRILFFVSAVILFAILMNYVNFLLISFLYLFGSMILLSRQKMFVSFIVSASFSVVFYYLFVHVFHIVFPA